MALTANFEVAAKRMDDTVRPEALAPARVDGPPEAPSRRASLLAEGLRQTYGAVTALDDVSLTLAPGEILALVGPSGSGKSTLLRIVAGLERPAKGQVTIDGREVSGPRSFVPPEARGIGLMFQDYALFPHMTIIENVMFGLTRLASAEAREIARKRLAQVGLAAYADDYPHALSGGEQQRVALARALAPSPSVLLMDEPFSNLDRRTRDLVRDETSAVLRESGAAAVLVTHDPEDAMRMADRIVLMQSGRIVQAGSAEELYRRPDSLFVARFFSDFNEIAGVCRDGAVETPIGKFPAHGLRDSQKAIVCLRPNAWQIHTGSPLHHASHGPPPPLRGGGPGTDAPLVGRVDGKCFLGDVNLVQVSVPALDRPLQIRAPLHLSLSPGQHVGIDFSREDALIFADE